MTPLEIDAIARAIHAADDAHKHEHWRDVANAYREMARDAVEAMSPALDEVVKAVYAECAEIARKEARNFAYVSATDFQDECTWEAGSPHDRGREECGDAIAAAIEARAKGEGNE